jgi:hypothetical protein
MKKFIYLVIALLTISLTFTSCEKDDQDPQPQTQPTNVTTTDGNETSGNETNTYSRDYSANPVTAVDDYYTINITQEKSKNHYFEFENMFENDGLTTEEVFNNVDHDENYEGDKLSTNRSWDRHEVITPNQWGGEIVQQPNMGSGSGDMFKIFYYVNDSEYKVFYRIHPGKNGLEVGRHEIVVNYYYKINNYYDAYQSWERFNSKMYITINVTE